MKKARSRMLERAIRSISAPELESASTDALGSVEIADVVLVVDFEVELISDVLPSYQLEVRILDRLAFLIEDIGFVVTIHGDEEDIQCAPRCIRWLERSDESQRLRR